MAQQVVVRGQTFELIRISDREMDARIGELKAADFWPMVGIPVLYSGDPGWERYFPVPGEGCEIVES